MVTPRVVIPIRKMSDSAVPALGDFPSEGSMAMRVTKSSQRRRRSRALQTVNPNAAGIDVGSQFHVVAVPPERDEV